MKCFIFLFSIILISFLSCRTFVKPSVDYSSILPINDDFTVNMVVEIPAGTTAKYEMNKISYSLELDSIDDKPRFIDYIGYPGNYGMIPNTILPKILGGDGDPLDVLLLGPPVERGSVQKVRIIGVLELLDNGEEDDKLVAISPFSKWSKITDIEDLEIYYPGIKTIIDTFFQNYKGKGKMELKNWSNRAKALEILDASISAK